MTAHSVAGWHMDTAVFGRPSFGLGQDTGQQFYRGIGNVGHGMYKQYNPTDGYPVTLKWEMDGPTFNTFITAWNTADDLRQGMNWFTLDLPLMLDWREPVGTNYVETNLPFAITVGVTGAQEYIGYRANSNIGVVQPNRLFGELLNRVSISTVSDHLAISFFNGMRMPAPNNSSFGVDTRITEDGDARFLTATWNGSAYLVTNLSGTGSTIQSNWLAGEGTTKNFHMIVQMTREQRYVAHWVAPYNATKIGYDMWEVSGQIEIDLSPYIYKIA